MTQPSTSAHHSPIATGSLAATTTCSHSRLIRQLYDQAWPCAATGTSASTAPAQQVKRCRSDPGRGSGVPASPPPHGRDTGRRSRSADATTTPSSMDPSGTAVQNTAPRSRATVLPKLPFSQCVLVADLHTRLHRVLLLLRPIARSCAGVRSHSPTCGSTTTWNSAHFLVSQFEQAKQAFRVIFAGYFSHLGTWARLVRRCQG